MKKIRCPVKNFENDRNLTKTIKENFQEQSKTVKSGPKWVKNSQNDQNQ